MNVSDYAAYVSSFVAKSFGFALVLSALASSARADIPMPAPEVDPGSLASAMTLLIGGALTLTGRVTRRR